MARQDMKIWIGKKPSFAWFPRPTTIRPAVSSKEVSVTHTLSTERSDSLVQPLTIGEVGDEGQTIYRTPIRWTVFSIAVPDSSKARPNIHTRPEYARSYDASDILASIPLSRHVVLCLVVCVTISVAVFCRAQALAARKGFPPLTQKVEGIAFEIVGSNWLPNNYRLGLTCDT